MKCRAHAKNSTFKKSSGEINRRNLIFIFLTTFILSGAPVTAIAVGWNPHFFWIGPVVGAIIGFAIARENYHKMLTLGLDEYNRRYRYPVCCCHTYPYPFMRDSGCPQDPASTAYWTLGRGRGGIEHD